MKLENAFTFVKIDGGEKKLADGGKKFWARVTLIDDEHNVLTVFASKEKAEVIYNTAINMTYGEVVTAEFNVIPMFDGKGFNCSLTNISY